MEMRAFRRAATGDLPAISKTSFSRPAITSLARVNPGRNAPLHSPVEIVFQIGVRQRRRIEGKHILHLLKVSIQLGALC